MPPRIITTADRTTIYTCSAGDPTKQAVVFIPGLCCTALAFQKQLEDRALTERVFVVRLVFGGPDVIHFLRAQTHVELRSRTMCGAKGGADSPLMLPRTRASDRRRISRPYARHTASPNRYLLDGAIFRSSFVQSSIDHYYSIVYVGALEASYDRLAHSSVESD